jgi:hypothetical protein
VHLAWWYAARVDGRTVNTCCVVLAAGLVVNGGVGCGPLDGFHAVERVGLRFVRFARGDDLAVAGLQTESELAAGIGVDLELAATLSPLSRHSHAGESCPPLRMQDTDSIKATGDHRAHPSGRCDAEICWSALAPPDAAAPSASRRRRSAIGVGWRRDEADRRSAECAR